MQGKDLFIYIIYDIRLPTAGLLHMTLVEIAHRDNADKSNINSVRYTHRAIRGQWRKDSSVVTDMELAFKK